MNLTENTRTSAVEPSGARQIVHRMTRMPSRAASQQSFSEEEVLQRGMEEKSKEFVEVVAEVYAKA